MAFTEAEIEKIVSEKIFALTLKKVDNPHEDLIAAGILGSITVAELAVALEEACKIRFHFVEVSRENFASINAIRSLVIQKLQDVL